MVYYFAVFYYISKSLKIDDVLLQTMNRTTASYFCTCPESIFKAYGSCYFGMNKGFLTKEKAIVGSFMLKKAVLKIS